MATEVKSFLYIGALDTLGTQTYHVAMTMIARYPGTCSVCKGRISKGVTAIEWDPSNPGTAKHAVAAECHKDAWLFAPPTTLSTIGTAALAKLRPTGPRLAAPATPNGKSIVAFVQAARDRGLKYPKVRFLGPTGEISMALAGVTSHYPGALQVRVRDEWIGRIGPDGVVAGPLGNRPDILTTLEQIAADPAKAATAYGVFTGHCFKCEAKLEDDGSLEVGYGPTCAKNFGLPWKRKGVRRRTPVAAPNMAAIRARVQADSIKAKTGLMDVAFEEA